MTHGESNGLRGFVLAAWKIAFFPSADSVFIYTVLESYGSGRLRFRCLRRRLIFDAHCEVSYLRAICALFIKDYSIMAIVDTRRLCCTNSSALGLVLHKMREVT